VAVNLSTAAKNQAQTQQIQADIGAGNFAAAQSAEKQQHDIAMEM
jgi:hypothetical protein